MRMMIRLTRQGKLADYVKQIGISRADVDQYISRYPDATFRYFYEMRLDYVLA